MSALGLIDISQLDVQTIEVKNYLEDETSKDLRISVAPVSSEISFRTQKTFQFASLESINENLLQVTIADRALVFDLAEKIALVDFSNMGQVFESENFVPAAVNVQKCVTIDSLSPVRAFHVTMDTNVNHAKDFYFKTQRWHTHIKSSEKSDSATADITSRDLEPAVFTGSFRTHCEADLEELKLLRDCLSQNKSLSSLDTQAFLSVYLGVPVFAMQYSVCLYAAIDAFLKQAEFKPDLDENENEIECHQLRRLYLVMSHPLPYLIDKKKFDEGAEQGGKAEGAQSERTLSIWSVLELMPYTKNIGECNKLLSCASQCNMMSLQSLCRSQADAEELLQKNSSAVINILQNSARSSLATQMIAKAHWPEGLEVISFTHNSCVFNED